MDPTAASQTEDCVRVVTNLRFLSYIHLSSWVVLALACSRGVGTAKRQNVTLPVFRLLCSRFCTLLLISAGLCDGNKCGFQKELAESPESFVSCEISFPSGVLRLKILTVPVAMRAPYL